MKNGSVAAALPCAIAMAILPLQVQPFSTPFLPRGHAAPIGKSSSTARFSSLETPSLGMEEIVANGKETGNDEEKFQNGTAVSTGSQLDLAKDAFVWTKQWYPVLPASYLLDDKPTKISVLGQDLVIWKTQSPNEISVLQDSCPHRRAPLSTGKIVGDRLACRYHGWEFDTSGTCTNIPMDATNQYSDKFGTKSYHAQIKGGLVWIFMDPNVETPPEISSEIVDDEANASGWMMNVSPVSFLSQIENSYDPTHAPFTHEGIGFGPGGAYSPLKAVPMERYELKGPPTKNGFALEHTPYQQTAPGMEHMTYTRKYVPPCTSITESPFFSANFHFVPSKPGETIVLAKFGRPPSKMSNNIVSRVIPKPVKTATKDFIHFYFQLSDARYKFLMQDQINMQGQDLRKVQENKWDDMTPTPSDAGVKAFQRWMKRFGGGGPFPLAELGGHHGRELSVWDSHGRYCSQFQAAVRRLAGLKKVMNRVSGVSIGLSVVGVLVSSLASVLARQRVALSAGSFGLGFLVMSVASRFVSQFCATLIGKSFVTGESDAHLRTMELYPATN